MSQISLRGRLLASYVLLLAIALGIDPLAARFELNPTDSLKLLESKGIVATSAA